MVGHSQVQELYILLRRNCPLAPQLYRQEVVCASEDVPFQSKIDLMETLILIRPFGRLRRLHQKLQT